MKTFEYGPAEIDALIRLYPPNGEFTLKDSLRSIDIEPTKLETEIKVLEQYRKEILVLKTAEGTSLVTLVANAKKTFEEAKRAYQKNKNPNRQQNERSIHVKMRGFLHHPLPLLR